MLLVVLVRTHALVPSFLFPSPFKKAILNEQKVIEQMNKMKKFAEEKALQLHLENEQLHEKQKKKMMDRLQSRKAENEAKAKLISENERVAAEAAMREEEKRMEEDLVQELYRKRQEETRERIELRRLEQEKLDRMAADAAAAAEAASISQKLIQASNEAREVARKQMEDSQRIADAEAAENERVLLLKNYAEAEQTMMKQKSDAAQSQAMKLKSRRENKKVEMQIKRKRTER